MKNLFRILLCTLLCITTISASALAPRAKSVRPIKRSGKAWGMETQVDVAACDPYRIRSAEAIRQYAVELAALLNLDAKRIYRDPIVTHDGDNEDERGYSMIQLIGKALISAHFVNSTNALHLTVLSCKPYNPKEIAEFTKAFFSSQDYTLNVTARR